MARVSPSLRQRGRRDQRKDGKAVIDAVRKEGITLTWP
jgi:hypothetical protein